MRKNKKYIQSEVFPDYEAWKRSGVPQKAFCQKHGISYSTFLYRSRKYRKTNKTVASPTGFIPVSIKPDPEPVINSSVEKLHFIFPNGVQLLCSETINPILIKNLINP